MDHSIEAVSAKHLYQLSGMISRADDLKPALNGITSYLRKVLIFDNLVIYLLDSKQNLNAYYGRAIGRGRDAGADVAWGEKIANQIIEHNDILVQNPLPNNTENRLEKPYHLGIPLSYSGKSQGALIFIRFGSPPFNAEDCHLAKFVAQQLSILISRQHLEHEYALLQGQRQQIRIQEDFISGISHELRTPLGCIKGYTTTLLRADTSWDKSIEQEFLQIIEKETDHLQQLIDNLLDSSRLNNGLLKMNFHPILPDGVVKDTIARTRLRYPDIRVKLDIPDYLEPIEGDSNRLNQVIDNIINNAIKYAPESEIWVKIKQDNHFTVLSIRDFGPGIPEKYLPFIFDQFFRNPDISPNIHGTGLGLFICQQIVQAHQGQIEVMSVVGEGTTFIVTLPDKQSQPG